MEKLWPYLRSASREVFKIIGKDNYEICEQEYDAESGNSEKKEFLQLVKYAVAIDAWRKYAPLIDVASTNEGRLFRRDDHNVGGFEWQIERHDSNLEKNYYRALDEIIAFVVESETFHESDYMLQFNGLFVPNLEAFQKFVYINDSHLLYLMLAPSLRLCEQREIINRMGDKFEEYKKNKDSYIHNLIQNICVYFAMEDGIQKHSVQLFPEGLMKAETYGRKTATGYDKEAAALYYRKEKQSLLKILESEIRKLNTNYTATNRINFGETDGFVTIS